MYERIKWYVKQILPLTYRTKWRDENGILHFCVWNMWFGHIYNTDEFVVKETNQMSPDYQPSDRGGEEW